MQASLADSLEQELPMQKLNTDGLKPEAASQSQDTSDAGGLASFGRNSD